MIGKWSPYGRVPRRTRAERVAALATSSFLLNAIVNRDQQKIMSWVRPGLIFIYGLIARDVPERHREPSNSHCRPQSTSKTTFDADRGHLYRGDRGLRGSRSEPVMNSAWTARRSPGYIDPAMCICAFDSRCSKCFRKKHCWALWRGTESLVQPACPNL